jgi:hypothetical protein
MTTELHKDLQPQLTVEFLAQESAVSIDEVTQLCAAESALIGVGARVTDFVPLLAIRRVRRALRQRRTALPRAVPSA